ncbi:MAG: hypothetical protein KAI72_08905 [Candidatus Pacebacteria bacterium]|nr:hypothetical protein [Candidatus Paceibacterota bacterium]
MPFKVRYPNGTVLLEADSFLEAAHKSTKDSRSGSFLYTRNRMITNQIPVVVESITSGREENFLYTEDGDFQEI